MLDSLTAVNLLEDRGLFVQTVRRDDDRYRLADSLFAL